MADLADRLRAALRDAMKSRDRDAVTALRTTLGALDNAAAVAPGESGPLLASGPIAGAARGVGATEVERREVSDDEAAAVVVAEIEEREDAAAGFEQAGQVEHATRLRAEVAALRAVLTPGAT